MDHDTNDLLPLNDSLKDALSEQIAKTIALEVGNKFSEYTCARRSNKLKVDSHRKGPVPIEECILTKSTQNATYGTLDSECEELDFEEVRVKNSNSTEYNKIRITTNDKGDTIASCRALIMYFSKLAKAKDEEEVIDLNFVENLFDSGADINFPDRHGQTILHEIARGWHPDVAKFALENGAEINKADLFGRTPLHLAAAVDYGEMVEYLVENGSELGRETFEEKQTAMHYAAKNNAAHSLKIMLRLGARINDRDYKRRTPLFVAAEAARADSARFLIEQGAPCGVYDNSGTPLLSLLIEKMPQIAMEGISQFHIIDRAFRKHYYYLSYLESDPVFLSEKIPEDKREQKDLKARKKSEKKLMKEQGTKLVRKKPKSYAKTPLEVIVQYNQLDLIMHPVFQRLLYVKWNLFGKTGSIKSLILNLFYTLIWTVLGILIPRDEEGFYIPLTENWWRIILESIGVILTIYFLIIEISLLKSVENSHNSWRHWRSQHLEKDLKFCHPRWPEEEKYLRSELNQIRSYQRTYFREPWNIFEWVTYLVILTLIFTRVLAVASGDKVAKDIHPRVYAIGLVIIWLRFMRSCRSFRMLGPFIAILGSVIADTLKFAFLFFEFFIPYTVAFWILFGGHSNGKIMTADNAVNWTHFQDLTFSVWWMTLIGDFNWDGLVLVDRLMAQILCGSYFALSGVVCMNLYIALLSDTFSRVYLQAQANAVMQQAKTIILLESNVDKFYRSKYGHYMQEHCSPQEVYTREDTNIEDSEEGKLDRMIRQIVNRIDELDDSWKRKEASLEFRISSGQPRKNSFQRNSQIELDTIDDFIREQRAHNTLIETEIGGLRNGLTDIRSILYKKQMLQQQTAATNQNDFYRSATLPNKSKQINNNLINVNQNLSASTNFDPRSTNSAFKQNIPDRKKSISDMIAQQSMTGNAGPGGHKTLSRTPSQRRTMQEQIPMQQISPQHQQKHQHELEKGINEMQYLQQRLEDLTNSEDLVDFAENTPETYLSDSAPPRKLYPQISDTSNKNSGRSTPSRRRRRKKKAARDEVNLIDQIPMSTRPHEMNTFPLSEQIIGLANDSDDRQRFNQSV